MRRRLGLAGLGTFGVLAAVVAMMVASGGPEVPPDMRIVVPQAENTELAMPRPSTVDIPEIPHAAATTEISTPPIEQAKPAAKPKQKPTPPPATQAPPPADPPSTDDTVSQYPWWLQYYYYTGGGYGSGGYGGSAGRYGGGYGGYGGYGGGGGGHR